jgi:Protein of unknown function (DUF3810)
MTWNKDKRNFWIILGMVTIFLRALASLSPELTEHLYSRGVFPLIRKLFDWTIGWISVPMLYILLIVVPVFLIGQMIRGWRREGSLGSKVFQFFYTTLAVICGVVTLFLWLWGFNYLRIPIEKQMGIQPKPLSVIELKEELDFYTTKIEAERNLLTGQLDKAITDNDLPADLHEDINNNMVFTMRDLGYPASQHLPVRSLFKGSLLRIGTAGFYLPFSGECNIDNGLHPLQKPYVLAHEMAHGQGIGDEGSCNFIAFLACLHSKNTFVRYSGYLSLWRTLAGNYRQLEPEEYAALRNLLPKGIVADLDAINANNLRYPDIFPELRDHTYDAFLKTQGISEGQENYNRVIVLERAWRLKQQSNPDQID